MQRKFKRFSSFSIKYTGNTQETQNDFLGAIFLSITRKDSKERKEDINCFSNKTAYWAPQTKWTESLKVELIFPGFHNTLFLTLSLHIQVAYHFKNCHGKQNLFYCRVFHKVKETWRAEKVSNPYCWHLSTYDHDKYSKKAILGFKAELYIISFSEPWGYHCKAQWSILRSE